MENKYILQCSEHIFTDLYLCSCGYIENKPCHDFTSIDTSNYCIYFILDGKFDCYIEQNNFTIEKNQGCLIKPDYNIASQKNSSGNFTYLWISFNGTQADFIFNQLYQQKTCIFSLQEAEELKLIVLKLLEQNFSNLKNELLIQSFLYQSLSLLIKIKAETIPEPIITKEKTIEFIEQAKEFIGNNYCAQISTQDIADYICINRSYLYTLFQKIEHQSPQEFLTYFRITKAAELLETTDLSIESISVSCGYTDPLMFAKIFKTIKEVSPSHYRKSNLTD